MTEIGPEKPQEKKREETSANKLLKRASTLKKMVERRRSGVKSSNLDVLSTEEVIKEFTLAENQEKKVRRHRQVERADKIRIVTQSYD